MLIIAFLSTCTFRNFAIPVASFKKFRPVNVGRLANLGEFSIINQTSIGFQGKGGGRRNLLDCFFFFSLVTIMEVNLLELDLITESDKTK